MHLSILLTNVNVAWPNPALKFAPFGRWDAPSARPLAARWAIEKEVDPDEG